MRKGKDEKDYCDKCPMYWLSQDYWGEWDEGCEIWRNGWFDGEDFGLICRMPRFIKHIYLAYQRFRIEVECLKYLNGLEDKEDGEIHRENNGEGHEKKSWLIG